MRKMDEQDTSGDGYGSNLAVLEDRKRRQCIDEKESYGTLKDYRSSGMHSLRPSPP
jgi:hypothetical protein